MYELFIKSILKDKARNNDKAIYKLINKMIELISIYSDKALFAYNKSFDNMSSRLMCMHVYSDFINVDVMALFRVKVLYDKIYYYHTGYILDDRFYIDNIGIRLGSVWKPLSSICIHISGDPLTYISTMLTHAIPAKLAGVEHIYVAVPYHKIKDKQLFMAIAYMCNVDYIYTFNGPQAIVALALGTKIVKRVDKVVGVGDTSTIIAMKMLFGNMSLNNSADYLKAMVIADQTVNFSLVSIDLAAQLEYDKFSLVILVVKSLIIAAKVRSNVMAISCISSRKDIINKNLSTSFIIVVCKSSTSLCCLVNRVCPTHLHINTPNSIDIMSHINTAGVVFLGRNTSISLGGYIIGLDFSRAGNISVIDFKNRRAVIHIPNIRAVRLLCESIVKLALIEGMELHAYSMCCGRN